MEHKDYFGNELNIGDEVIYLPRGRYGTGFESMTIIGFTPKMAKIHARKEVDGKVIYDYTKKEFTDLLVKFTRDDSRIIIEMNDKIL